MLIRTYSLLYPVAQVIALALTLNLVFPMVLHIGWNGSILDLCFFAALFFLLYGIGSAIFLAVTGYFAIMMEVARSLPKLKMEDVRNENVAKAMALRVLMGNQPRWLISLTPCVVPALSLAFLSIFYGKQLQIDNWQTLLKMCLLQALTSFVLCVPVILKAQRNFTLKVDRGFESPDEGPKET